MGWRGAGEAGIAGVGSYYFIVSAALMLTRLDGKLTQRQGGLLMTLGGILEFFLGNTFSFVVFCSFGKSAPARFLVSQDRLMRV